jgi:hypothetical protein
MTNFYLVTIFVVLLTGAEAIDKATSGARHLPNQGAAASREGWLAGQRSRGLGCNVRVVDVRGVQSHCNAESAEPTEQAVGASLRGGRSRPQDPKAGTILFLSFCINLFITLASMLQKKSTGVEPHYLDVCLLVHDDDEATTEKLVSNNITCYA